MSAVTDSVDHQPGEATPQDVVIHPAMPATGDFGLHDSSWTDEEWHGLLRSLVDNGMASWKDVASLVLGHLNPSQVGTSLASSKGFKRKYGKGKTMKVVMEWVYRQTGRCADCQTRLELQADHVKGREQFADPLDADFIENMTMRCRRCNVIRRPSHEFGGETYLTAEAALMWILLVIRPRTFRDFVRLCRLYGMTMSDIRMQEAWAMAHWLAREKPPAYGIEDDAQSCYDLVIWQDGAITRVDSGKGMTQGVRCLYERVPGTSFLGFITRQEDGRFKLFEHPISFIPFSTYDLGKRPKQSLAIRYSPPNRKKKLRGKLVGLPPRGMDLICHAVRTPEQCFQLVSTQSLIPSAEVLSPAPIHGKIVRTKLPLPACRLEAIERSERL